jgi:hypothetical protein
MTVTELQPYQKLWIAMKLGAQSPKVLTGLSAEARALISPTNLLIFAAILAIWLLGSAWGGPAAVAVDAALVVLAVVTWGKQFIQGGQDLYAFGTGALAAQSEDDLRRAGDHFADVLVDIGSAAIIAFFSGTAFAAARGLLLPSVKSVLALRGLPLSDAAPTSAKLTPKPEPRALEEVPASPPKSPPPKSDQTPTSDAESTPQPNPSKGEPSQPLPENSQSGPTPTKQIAKDVALDVMRGAGGSGGTSLAKGINPLWVVLPVGITLAAGGLYLLVRPKEVRIG